MNGTGRRADPTTPGSRILLPRLMSNADISATPPKSSTSVRQPALLPSWSTDTYGSGRGLTVPRGLGQSGSEPMLTGTWYRSLLWAWIMCAYHAIILCATLFYMIVYFHAPDFRACEELSGQPNAEATAPTTSPNSRASACEDTYKGIFILAAIWGACGGTLNASRYVVFAVVHNQYDEARILWQLLTPLWSCIIGTITILFLLGGLFSLASAPVYGIKFSIFTCAITFGAGFSAELVLKRLISMIEALFGESAVAQGTTLESVSRGGRPPQDGRPSSSNPDDESTPPNPRDR